MLLFQLKTYMNHLFNAFKNHERVEATRDKMDEYLRENNPRSENFDDDVLALGRDWQDAVSNLIS